MLNDLEQSINKVGRIEVLVLREKQRGSRMSFEGKSNSLTNVRP